MEVCFIHIKGLFYTLMGENFVCKLCIPGPVTKCQNLSDLPSSKSKISGPHARYIFHLAAAFSPALPVAGPWDVSLWGVGFNLNFCFFQTLLFCEHESPEFQDKPRLSRTHSFLLKCLQESACFEKTLEMISDLAEGVYLLPGVIFLSEYTFVRGILFLYLVQIFLIHFSNCACLIPLSVNESLMLSLKWRKRILRNW